MDLNHLLPVYDFRSYYTRRVAAGPDAAWRAFQALTIEDLPTAHVLTQLRGFGRARRSAPVREGFPMPLLAASPHEEIRGGVARFWHVRPVHAELRGGGPEAFRDFTEPGWAKAAVSVRAVPEAGGSVLIAETRVRCTDAAARRAFGVYWLLIRASGGLLRLEMLRVAARHAEREAAVAA
ncbi:hypothetical protein RKE29_07770 [Streptomyces sp. B1866]|uniref:hypothetical protein n=1 Tax=Streptomyces sp. B1866 TaxID=3075431 RepID=UPI00288CCEEB|nr:hypothetical protein [Streptomyces sp. B1866]MDT3396539.1 hypothetical protein [Streptomyces sp. B1866]